MKLYWYNRVRNLGDQLAPVIVEHFTGMPVQFADRGAPGKLLAVGSILNAVGQNDVIWGAGAIIKKTVQLPAGVKVLAVRGPLTAELIGWQGQVFGDPAILLPLFYKPSVQKKYKTGLLPHYIDQPHAHPRKGHHFIDITGPWQQVVNEILECEEIITSSLHGIIIAEAYGIPVKWVKYSNKIVGGEFKFNDYFLGSGRPQLTYFDNIPANTNLAQQQLELINALYNYLKQNEK